MRDFERMFLYGEALLDYASGYDAALTHARRTMKGVNAFLANNATDAGGTLTEAEFEAFLRSVFRYGGSSRYLFCSPLIISVISQWAQGKLQIFPKDKTYGRDTTAVVKSSYMTGNSRLGHNTNEVKIYGQRQSAGKRYFMAKWINRWRRMYQIGQAYIKNAQSKMLKY